MLWVFHIALMLLLALLLVVTLQRGTVTAFGQGELKRRDFPIGYWVAVIGLAVATAAIAINLILTAVDVV